MKYDVGSIDLDWARMEPRENDGPNSGMECLAEWLEEGWEVIAVWWDGTDGGRNRALLKRPSRESVT